MKVNYNNVTPEIILNILRHVSPKDLKSTRLVCKLWEEVASGLLDDRAKSKLLVKASRDSFKTDRATSLTAISLIPDVKVRNQTLRGHAVALMKEGDLKGALKSVAMISSDSEKDSILKTLSLMALKSGDVDGALEAVSMMSKDWGDLTLKEEILLYLTDKNDQEGVLKVEAFIEKLGDKRLYDN